MLSRPRVGHFTSGCCLERSCVGRPTSAHMGHGTWRRCSVPWGTPDVTGLVSDDFPSMTVCSRCDINYSIHPRVFPVIPIASSLNNRRLWATLLNAFAKSIRMASVWVLPFSDFKKLFAERRSCDSHERLFLKPCWALSKMLFKSKCLMTWELTICSMTWEHIKVRDTGW